tara:strand:+ start:1786 stop:2130 length:345 start_codon:yes stop_codon:yes gene_type:complete
MELIRRYINENDLKAKGKKQVKAWNRFYICSYLRDLGYTLHEIAREINRDHAAVVNGLKQHKLLKRDELFIELTSEVRSLFPIGQSNVGVNFSTVMFQILASQDNKILTNQTNK